MRWWRLAAAQGYSDAEYNLGVAYDNGTGVVKDIKEAANWFRLAADKGNPLAQYSLGNMQLKGEAVPQDYLEAYKWFSLAASRFAAGQTELRDAAAKNRDGAAARLTPTQLAEARQRADNWMPNLAANTRTGSTP